MTKQITLSNGQRPRVYMLPPKEPQSARQYWVETLHSKTEKDLGILYEKKTGKKPQEPKEYHTNSDYAAAKQGE